MTTTTPLPPAAYRPLPGGCFASSELTRGPWSDAHQHAGPPVALVCRAVRLAAAAHGLTHIARVTANLLRPVPLGVLAVEVSEDYVGRNAGHFSARLLADGKEVARFTLLVQRALEVALPHDLPGHPLPLAPRAPEASPEAEFPFAGRVVGYADLVQTRLAAGRLWHGPCAVWFRLRTPLVEGEQPGPCERVAVAADSGNGISAVLDYQRYTFVNSDLTINLLRPAQGEWICLEASTAWGPHGGGLAQSRLYDERGLVGHATQSLAVRLRAPD